MPSERQASWSARRLRASSRPRSSRAGGLRSVDQAAYVGNGGAGVATQRSQQVTDRVRFGVDQVGGGVRGQGDAGQGRAKPVVQILTDPSTLLLPGRHDSLPRPLEVVGQLHRPHRGRQRRRDDCERALVGRRKLAFARAQTDQQLAELVSRVGQGHRCDVVSAGAVLGHHAGRRGDRYIGEPQGRAHGGNDPVQPLLVARDQVLTHPGGDPPRVVAVAVDPAVDDSLELGRTGARPTATSTVTSADRPNLAVTIVSSAATSTT